MPARSPRVGCASRQMAGPPPEWTGQPRLAQPPVPPRAPSRCRLGEPAASPALRNEPARPRSTPPPGAPLDAVGWRRRRRTQACRQVFWQAPASRSVPALPEPPVQKPATRPAHRAGASAPPPAASRQRRAGARTASRRAPPPANTGRWKRRWFRRGPAPGRSSAQNPGSCPLPSGRWPMQRERCRSRPPSPDPLPSAGCCGA